MLSDKDSICQWWLSVRRTNKPQGRRPEPGMERRIPCHRQGMPGRVNCQAANATNPNRRSSTSWLSSTTQAFKAPLAAQGQNLPCYSQQVFDDFHQCGRLEYGFLRVRCESCHHERLMAFSCTGGTKRRFILPCTPKGGAPSLYRSGHGAGICFYVSCI